MSSKVDKFILYSCLTSFLLACGSTTVGLIPYFLSSLTISKTYKNNFNLNIIPHTLKLTNLKDLKINSHHIINENIIFNSNFTFFNIH